ncbi:hypothetical protein Tco_1153428 [Tanacetum coccineum]
MWKAKTLSFGGRLTLIKSVLDSLGVYYFSSFKAPISVINKLETIRRRFFLGGNIEENKIALIAWDKIMSPLIQGGLGVGSLWTCNQAMLCKWWWRYCVENDATWCKLIRSIHGVEGGFRNPPHSRLHSSPWRQIVKLENDLVSYGINLPDVFKKKIGNGCNTLFWLDTWIGNEPLKDSFPRLFRLESNPLALVYDRAPVSTSFNNLATGGLIASVGTIPINHFAPFTPGPVQIQLPHGLLFRWGWNINPLTPAEIEELTIFTELVSHLHLNNETDNGFALLTNLKPSPSKECGSTSPRLTILPPQPNPVGTNIYRLKSTSLHGV